MTLVIAFFRLLFPLCLHNICFIFLQNCVNNVRLFCFVGTVNFQLDLFTSLFLYQQIFATFLGSTYKECCLSHNSILFLFFLTSAYINELSLQSLCESFCYESRNVKERFIRSILYYCLKRSCWLNNLQNYCTKC